MKRAKEIADAVEELWDYCETIKENGKCGEHCPMSHLCLEETPFVEIADLLHSELVERMITTAEA